MRTFKFLIMALATLLVLAIIVAWTLPAALFYRYAAYTDSPVILSGISGTLWKGHADGISVFGRDVGEIDWTVDKSALLGLRVVADLRLRGVDIDVAGEVARHRDGSVHAHDVRFRFPAALLGPAIDVPNLRLVGTIDGVLADAAIEHGWIAGASGTARWSEAGVSGQAEARFADVLAEFATQADGSIAGTVHDSGGSLEIDGTFSVRATGFDAQARLRARDNDPHVLEALRYVGQSQADGSSLLVIHGRMFRLM
jgi:hypothetical protein